MFGKISRGTKALKCDYHLYANLCKKAEFQVELLFIPSFRLQRKHTYDLHIARLSSCVRDKVFESTCAIHYAKL